MGRIPRRTRGGSWDARTNSEGPGDEQPLAPSRGEFRGARVARAGMRGRGEEREETARSAGRQLLTTGRERTRASGSTVAHTAPVLRSGVFVTISSRHARRAGSDAHPWSGAPIGETQPWSPPAPSDGRSPKAPPCGVTDTLSSCAPRDVPRWRCASPASFRSHERKTVLLSVKSMSWK